MVEGDRHRPKWLDTIAGDTRQTIVGLIVTAIVLGGGGWLLGVASSEAPLWSVGLIALISGATLLAVTVSYDRRHERLQGRLTEVQTGAEELVKTVKDNARERIDAAEKEAQGKVNATESFARVNVSEAEGRTRAVSQQLEDARRQLAEATSGQVPLTREAEAVLRSVRSLVSDLESSAESSFDTASSAQELAFLAIVEDFQETFGESTLLQRAYTIPTGQDRDEEFTGYIANAPIREMLTMLSQLDAYALSHGQASRS